MNRYGPKFPAPIDAGAGAGLRASGPVDRPKSLNCLEVVAPSIPPPNTAETTKSAGFRATSAICPNFAIRTREFGKGPRGGPFAIIGHRLNAGQFESHRAVCRRVLSTFQKNPFHAHAWTFVPGSVLFVGEVVAHEHARPSRRAHRDSGRQCYPAPRSQVRWTRLRISRNAARTSTSCTVATDKKTIDAAIAPWAIPSLALAVTALRSTVVNATKYHSTRADPHVRTCSAIASRLDH